MKPTYAGLPPKIVARFTLEIVTSRDRIRCCIFYCSVDGIGRGVVEEADLLGIGIVQADRARGRIIPRLHPI